MADESRSFQVLSGAAVNVAVTNLYAGEQFLLRYAVDLGHTPSSAAYSDYYENGKSVVLDTEHNPLTLWRPGYYKLVPDGAINADAQVYLSQPFAASLTAALNNVAEVSSGT
ncbi:MAG: hypothetical protein JSS23_02895 [Proteobacteria bacterium]|nr:hypothetical protein [Pseudomonadota bacterium]